MFDSLVRLVREQYGEAGDIGLHEPTFGQAERQALLDVMDSGMVSSVGQCVNEFERQIAQYTGVAHAVATVNGTSALHVSLLVAGVQREDLVLTQSLTFVATCNAIAYCGAEPVFVDVERETLGMCPRALQEYLSLHAERHDDGHCWHRSSGKRIAVCMPMHTFGNPASMIEICAICERYGISVVEDSAEALGSHLEGRHCGTFGKLGVLSFNGNKILTTGGGGMVLTDDDELASRVRHLTTTARVVDSYRWSHDEVAYNYRLPNINAALGVAQFASLPKALECKRRLAELYCDWCSEHDRQMISGRRDSVPNNWLNALVCETVEEREALLRFTCEQGIATRPIWVPMHYLPMYRDCQRGSLEMTEWAAAHVINLPSSVPHDG